LVLAIVCIAQFMVILDATIVNVALPSIQHGLDFSQSSLQWVVNAYTLIFGGFLLLGGRASDLIGRQRLFLAGVALFTIASAVNGVAQSSGMLVGGRALQGLGAALVSPAALAIVTTTFAEGRERAKAMGVWSAIAAGGGAVGLVLGGLLTETLSWRWVFFINLPIGVAAILLSLRYVPDAEADERPETADVAGAVTVTGGLLVLVYGIVKAQEYGWTSWKTLGLGALAVALLAAFTWIEAHSREPLIRLGIFKSRALTASNGGMLLVASGMFAMFYFASIYVQEVLGYSPVQAGLAFVPFTLGIVIGAGAAQSLIRRLGVKWLSIVGLVGAIAGEALFVRVSVDGTYWGQLLPAIVVMSIGMGLTFVPLTLVATTNIASEDAGLASGLFNTAQQVGGALGLAILSTLAASRTSHLESVGVKDSAEALTRGYHVAFAVGALMLVLGGAVLAATVRRQDAEAIDAGHAAESPVAL
jgi:EmrB/QacA subfamily drug resistance transporter